MKRRPSRRKERANGSLEPGRESFFRLVVERSADAILVLDRKGIVRFMNPAAERLFDRPADQMLGRLFGFPLDARGPQELDILRPREDSRVAEMRVVKIEGRGESLYVANLRDITEHVRLREALRAMSLIDALTGLYNRRGFLTLGQQQLKIANRTKRALFLLFVDVDRMKWINDTFGHDEGDRALLETADVLRETFRESDIVARVGGDEFAVIAVDARVDSGDRLAGRLRENLERRNGGARRYRASVSLGVAAYDPEAPCPIDELCARADALMYADKRSRGRA